MKKINIAKPQLFDILAAINNTWVNIVADVSLYEEMESNESAIELCIEGNRLGELGGQRGREADALMKQLVKEYGFFPVLKFLASKTRLV
jgi:hypothetical protein